MLETPKGYYVYGLVDPKDNQVFYIGKGIGDRAWQHFTEVGRSSKIKVIDAIQADDKQPIVKIYQDDLKEEVAYVLERILIHRIGTMPFNGPLTNMLIGGKDEYSRMALEPHEIFPLRYIKYEYPEILDTIISVPETSKEKEIEASRKSMLGKVLDKINSLDNSLLTDIEATKLTCYRDETNEFGEVISFDSILGQVFITFKDDDYQISPLLEPSPSSFYTIKRNNERIENKHNLKQKEVISELRIHLSKL